MMWGSGGLRYSAVSGARASWEGSDERHSPRPPVRTPELAEREVGPYLPTVELIQGIGEAATVRQLLTGRRPKRTIVHMKLVADTNTFLAVALNEPEKAWLVDVTQGCDLVAPRVLPYEVGNALSALVKRNALLAQQALDVWDAVARIPVELADLDIRAALLLAVRCGVYAYDAYFLQCALETRCPLLTLDEGMKQVAGKLDIKLVEQA